MNRKFVISSRLHPAYSLLGRWISRRAADRRAARSIFIVASVTLATALLISQYLTWAYLYPLSDAGVVRFFIGQTVIAAAYVLIAIIGRQPSISVKMTTEHLEVEQSGETELFPLSQLRAVSIISAQVYHTHYDRYAATHALVDKVYPQLLLLDFAGTPVVLGLGPEELASLEKSLATRLDASYPSPRVGVA